MKSNDEEVEIKLTGHRLAGKMSEETKEKLKAKKVLKTRFVKVELSNGNILFHKYYLVNVLNTLFHFLLIISIYITIKVNFPMIKNF